MDDAHTKVGEEVLHYFKTDPETGLNDDQLKRYQEKYGPNGKYYFTWSSISLTPSPRVKRPSRWKLPRPFQINSSNTTDRQDLVHNQWKGLKPRRKIFW